MLRTSRRAVILTMPAILAASLLTSVSPLKAVTPVASPAISAPPDVIVGEADGYVDVVVSLSAPGQSTVTVNYSTSNDTAPSNGCNYDFSTDGTLSFAPGETTKIVRIELDDAPTVEGFESFFFNLSSADERDDRQGLRQVGIVDNDTRRRHARACSCATWWSTRRPARASLRRAARRPHRPGLATAPSRSTTPPPTAAPPPAPTTSPATGTLTFAPARRSRRSSSTSSTTPPPSRSSASG